MPQQKPQHLLTAEANSERYWSHPFLTVLNLNIFSHLLICVKLYSMQKNQLIPSVHSWDTINFRVQKPDWPPPFLTMPTQKKFDQLLIFVNYINMQKISLFHWFALEIWLIKIPAIWLAENILAHIPRTRNSEIWDLCRNTSNNMSFHYRTNSVKIKDQILSIISKKLCFLAHFHNFSGKKNFSKKSGQHAQLHMDF